MYVYIYICIYVYIYIYICIYIYIYIEREIYIYIYICIIHVHSMYTYYTCIHVMIYYFGTWRFSARTRRTLPGGCRARGPSSARAESSGSSRTTPGARSARGTGGGTVRASRRCRTFGKTFSLLSLSLSLSLYIYIYIYMDSAPDGWQRPLRALLQLLRRVRVEAGHLLIAMCYYWFNCMCYYY